MQTQCSAREFVLPFFLALIWALPALGQTSIQNVLDTLRQNFSQTSTVEYEATVTSELTAEGERYVKSKDIPFTPNDIAIHAISDGNRMFCKVDQRNRKRTISMAADGELYRSYEPDNQLGVIGSALDSTGNVEGVDSLVSHLTLHRFRTPYYAEKWVRSPDSFTATIEGESDTEIRLKLEQEAKKLTFIYVLDKTKNLAIQEYYPVSTTGKIINRYRTTAFKEEKDAEGSVIWIPEEGELEHYFWNNEFHEVPPCIQHFKLGSLVLNGTYSPETFQIEFPSGTELLDKRTGIRTNLSSIFGEDISALVGLISAKAVKVSDDTQDSVSGHLPPRDSRPLAVSTKPRNRSVWFVLIVAVSAVVALWAVYGSYRARRQGEKH